MNNKIISMGMVVALTVISASTLNAQTFLVGDDHDGRHYEIYIYNNNTDWETAKAFTETLNHLTVQGRLATITSEDEDFFIRYLAAGSSVSTELWVGGFQDPAADEPVPPTTIPYDGWTWLNGEDIPEPGATTGYENWDAGEPNNSGNEDHLGIGLKGYGANYGWNDEVQLGNVRGLVVEYGDIVEVDPTECTSPGGCATLPEEAQTLLFPPGTVIVPGVPVDVRTFEFIDEKHGTIDSRCGVSGRTLFGPLADAPLNEFAEARLPSWLCGSPRFLIVFLDSEDAVSFPTGTVLVENEPLTPLPLNLFECELAPMDLDLRHRDVVGWQATNFKDTVEYRFEMQNLTSEFASLFGTLGEVTDGCGSSRGRVRGSSYHAIGLHIHPADTVDMNYDFTVLQFVELTRYKLALLKFSLEEAKPFLKKGDFKKMQQQVKNAIKKTDRGNFSGAIKHMRNFIKFAERANYETGPLISNHNGEHLSRAFNIVFMLDEKTSLPMP